MADGQRLALIKDVAGTNVYDEKKAESEKILATSLLKMDEIKNVSAPACFSPHCDLSSRISPHSSNGSVPSCWQNLGMIEARLEKLDKEKQELSEYYALDKERRSVFPFFL